jgi:hypothetical protein
MVNRETPMRRRRRQRDRRANELARLLIALDAVAAERRAARRGAGARLSLGRS